MSDIDVIPVIVRSALVMLCDRLRPLLLAYIYFVIDDAKGGSEVPGAVASFSPYCVQFGLAFTYLLRTNTYTAYVST